MREIRNACVMTGVAAAMAMLAAGHAPAQDAAAPGAPPQAAAADGDRIVVRGRRMNEVSGDLEDHVSDFIGEVAAPPNDAGFARFQRRVCVGAYNLQNDAAQYIVDRVSALALEVGLDPGDPGCEPNVLIVFAQNGGAMASAMVESHISMFRPGGNTPYMQRGQRALEEFAESDAPVRWWHVSIPVEARTGAPAVELPTAHRPFDIASKPSTMMAGGGGSRIYSELRDDMLYSLVIVDVSRISGEITWEELGDYVALTALAQIDPNAELSAFDSILNLFDNPDAYSGLTDWDRSYIHALYSFDQQRTPRFQPIILVNEMARNAAVFSSLSAE